MEQQWINILLIVGLNIPVFLELYKHFLKNKPALFKAAAAVVYSIAAIATQTVAALAGILYLYFAYYRKPRADEDCNDSYVWHINASTALKAMFMTVIARIAILLIHLIYIIILVKLVKYNIRPQDIVVEYSNSELLPRILLTLDIVLIAPVVEEYVFRYFLYGKVFSERMPRAVAMILSAALFTVLHFNVSGIPTFFGLGLLCAFLYSQHGYWSSVVAHATSNVITLLLI